MLMGRIASPRGKAQGTPGHSGSAKSDHVLQKTTGL